MRDDRDGETAPELPRPATRRGDSGQALLFALLVLFIASLAAGFVAEDIALRERELQQEGLRMHVRALLDGALADALARIANDEGVPGQSRWGGGVTRVEITELGPNLRRVRVHAVYKGRAGAAEAIVEVLPSQPPRVVFWRRSYAG